MLSKWIIHSSNNPTCIALADNGTFIAAAAGSLLSFWDTTRRAQIGTVIEYTHGVWSMVISSNNHLVTSGHKKITLRALRDILPPHYLDNTPRMQEIQHKEVQKVGDGPNGRTANFENTVRELRNQLAKPQQTNQERDIPIQSLRAQEESSNSKITRLEKTVRERARSPRAASQEKDRLKETAHSLRGNLYTRDESSSGPITHPEQTIQELRVQLADTQRKADGLIRISHAYEQKHQYESLYAQGRIQGAAECLLEILNTVNEDVRGNKFIMDWLTELTPRCITALERVGDEASTAGKRDEAVAAYSTALSLGPSTPNTIMIKWVSMILKNGSAHEALSAATKFKVPRVVVYSAICDILARDGRLTEVVECFRQLLDELPQCGSIQSCHACTTACRPTQTFCDG
ncbi:hypothetical protein HD554DRAFT_298615 [Boletus coccyginus]|nr:hypothetical protein HD554DRAFT_298615 [Boletus coccyginus]